RSSAQDLRSGRCAHPPGLQQLIHRRSAGRQFSASAGAGLARLMGDSMRRVGGTIAFAIACTCMFVTVSARADVDVLPFNWQFSVEIPMRDGVRLHATVYRPRGEAQPTPCIFTLTPYVAQTYHDRGVYFASNGYAFLT